MLVEYTKITWLKNLDLFGFYAGSVWEPLENTEYMIKILKKKKLPLLLLELENEVS